MCLSSLCSKCRRFQRTPELSISDALLKSIVLQALRELHGEVRYLQHLFNVYECVCCRVVWCLNSSGNIRIQRDYRPVLLIRHQDIKMVRTIGHGTSLLVSY